MLEWGEHCMSTLYPEVFFDEGEDGCVLCVAFFQVGAHVADAFDIQGVHFFFQVAAEIAVVDVARDVLFFAMIDKDRGIVFCQVRDRGGVDQ